MTLSETVADTLQRPPVLLLMGPTCSGKTALAIQAAESLPVTLVNVDSALVYDGLEIGAARPTDEELARAPHRLLGFQPPTQPYSAADFRHDALLEIADIHRQGRIPLLVGGTMLYFKALVEGLAPMPTADPEVRHDIEMYAAEHGWPAVHAQLAEVDPDTAKRLKTTDSQRLQRALEVFRLTGRPISAYHQEHDQGLLAEHGDWALFKGFPYAVSAAALAPHDRAVLHRRIEKRFNDMLAVGLIDEVKRLRQLPGMHAALPAMKAVGYRQVWDYLEGRYDYAEMVDKGVIATRQLAKRQLTWLRKWPALRWCDSENPAEMAQLLAHWTRLCDSANQ